MQTLRLDLLSQFYLFLFQVSSFEKGVFKERIDITEYGDLSGAGTYIV